MKMTPRQFRERYNIALSTESKLKVEGRVVFERSGKYIVYDSTVTDALALAGKLGNKAYIAVSNILASDATEEHF